MSEYLMQYIVDTLKVPKKRADEILGIVEKNLKKNESPLSILPKIFESLKIVKSEESLLLCYFILDIAMKNMEDQIAFTGDKLKLKKGMAKVSASFGIKEDRAETIKSVIRKNIEKFSETDGNSADEWMRRMLYEARYMDPGERRFREEQIRRRRQEIDVRRIDKVRVIEASVNELKPKDIHELIFISFLAGHEIGYAARGAGDI